MPDLREDLGRLADFVGEPVGLDDLAAIRRRRERRRRTTGLVGGLTIVALFAALVFRSFTSGAPSTVPGDSPEPGAACGTATEVTVTARDLALSACTAWPADRRIDIMLINPDLDVPVGLELYAAEKCSIDECGGKSIWGMWPVVGGQQHGLTPPLPAGHYVLLDPVHPTTSRLAITVGDAGPTPSPSPRETPSVGGQDAGIPIPMELPGPSIAGCFNGSATEVDILLKELRLMGCGRWAAEATVTVHFEVADPGVPAGLMLFPLDQCGAGDCEGRPVWQSDVDTKPRTFTLDPLAAGTYVLLDPVHPMTSAVMVDVA